VERTFGSKIRWFKAGVAKYIGEAKTHGQHVLECIAYNLKRTPKLLMKVEVIKIQALITG
jgi:IS5 family transposase